MKKRMLSFISAVALLFGATGCSAVTKAENQKDSQLSIVCTLFPEYDWTREILGDEAENVNLTYLLDTGESLHSFQPSAKDMVVISDCDLFVYVGGESESWVDDALKEVTNPDMKVIKLMDVIGDSAKEEEVKEGMQSDEEEPEYDEHVWLSVKNAEALCSAICETLCEIQPESADVYRGHLDEYTQKLQKLDSDFADMAENASVKTVVFGDKFPFRYFVDDYHIDYYAAFVGCSAETEASFETIAFLAKKLDELHLNTIFTIQNTDVSVANAIIASTENKNQQIVTLNSMQSITRDDINNGATYLGIMQENLDTLREALQ